MADLKPDRVRAAELAQTGAGRGRARGEQAEREHESTCTLLEHDPDFITRGPRAGEENEDGSSRNIVDASVVLGSSERESDDSVSVDTNASHSTDLSFETAHLPAASGQGAAEGEARANAEGLGAGGLAACGIAVGAAAGRTVAEQGRQGRQLAAEATEAAATPTGDSQQCDAEAACARDWSRHWQAGAFAAWGWVG